MPTCPACHQESRKPEKRYDLSYMVLRAVGIGYFRCAHCDRFILASHGMGSSGSSRSSLRAKLLLSYVHARTAVIARRAAHIVKALLNGSLVSFSSIRTGV